MPLVSGSIPNLINGVSQQPPSLRLKTQGEYQLNGLSSVVKGLTKRPCAAYKHDLDQYASGDNTFHHTVRTSYGDLLHLGIAVGANGFTLVDANGVNKTLSATQAALDYLNTVTNPKEDIAVVTVADYTYIVNKRKPVATLPDLTPLPASDANRKYEALIYTKQGDYQTTYTLKARRPGAGWTTQSYTTGASTNDSTSATQAAESSIKTDNIASNLYNISLPAGINKARYNNVIHLYSSTEFEIEVEDSRGNNHLLGFKEEVIDFKQLPKDGPENFVIKVSGDNEKAQDDYYVKLITNTTGGGVWKETVAPGIKYKLDASTMPHQLRLDDATGNYVFEPMPWAERKAGDDDSNPFPLFAEDGLTINDIFFFRNRLGLLYDENIILSESGEFTEYNFFRRTALTVVDSDPIDVSVSNNQVSILKHAVPFNEALLLFSDKTQFKLNAIDILAPDTVSVDVTTQFEASTKAKPVGAGKYVFFPFSRGAYSGVREYFTNSNTDTNDATDITAHVPSYIKGNITAMKASSNEDIIVVQTDDSPYDLYVYRFYWQNEEKLQSAWSKWTFKDKVRHFEFENSTLLVAFERSATEMYMAEVSLSTDSSELITQGGWPVLLDARRLINPNTVTSFSTTEEYVYITDKGKVITKNEVVTYNQKGDYVFYGYPYSFKYTFSEQVMRQDKEPITIGRLQLRNMNVVYNDTGYFEAEVIPKGATDPANRASYRTIFSGRTVGGITNILNQPAISDGTFRINAMADTKGLAISLVSDSHLPCAFQSAEWEGYYRLRSNRV